MWAQSLSPSRLMTPSAASEPERGIVMPILIVAGPEAVLEVVEEVVEVVEEVVEVVDWMGAGGRVV